MEKRQITEDYINFIDTLYGEEKPADVLEDKCIYINQHLKENDEGKFGQIIDSAGVYYSDEELQKQTDDFILYTFGVLATSEEDARKMAEDGDIASLVGMEISSDDAVSIYRASQQEREKWQAVSENSDYTPSIEINPVGGHQHSR